MTQPRLHRTRRARYRQRGFSLIVSLILLALVMMLGLGSMRSVALESRMSAASQDRNLGFQGAETALREAEERAAAATAGSFPNTACSNGYCAMPAASAAARWSDDSFTGWRNAAASVSAGTPTPAAIVERYGDGENWTACGQEIPRQPNCRTPRYRVTGRSADDGRANVIVQSDVATH